MTKSDVQNLPLAMAYVPRQEFKEIYDMPKALSRGTIFAQLDLPFGGAV
ncbi:MAG: spore coat associated protein CotJA [Clostridia bacterium]|nr:spore coat associated protein CotJA [Clostridia bacterium]